VQTPGGKTAGLLTLLIANFYVFGKQDGQAVRSGARAGRDDDNARQHTEAEISALPVAVLRMAVR
jgi:hypothetical protein